MVWLKFPCYFMENFTMKYKRKGKKQTKRVKISPIKMSRTQKLTDKYLKRQNNLGNLKMSMVSEGHEIKTPAMGHVNQLWSRSKHNLTKGNYSKAAMFKLGALTVLASLVSPYSVGQLDKGRVGDERTGIHTFEDPNTLLKWHDPKLDIKKGKRMKREEKRLNKIFTRKYSKKKQN